MASPGHNELTYWGPYNIPTIWQMTFWNCFSWTKINRIKILIDIPWSLLLMVQWALNQNCFRKWLDFKQMPGYYLNQQAPILPTFLWVNLAKELSCISNISVYLTSMILLQYSFLTHCSLVTVWCCGPWWPLIHMIICCMMALSHYLNQYWRTISRVLHHSCWRNCTGNAMKVITKMFLNLHV